MPKGIKILLIIAVLVALGVVIFSLLNSGQNTGSNTQNIEESADDLTLEERQRLTEFVKNFLTLYNNFGYEDYSNLLALGDYETENAQKQTLERVEDLRLFVPIGFRRTSEISESSLKFQKLILPPDAVVVQVEVLVSEEIVNQTSSSFRSDDANETKNYSALAELKLVPYNSGWLVDSINLIGLTYE
jgi:hypothetical protein